MNVIGASLIARLKKYSIIVILLCLILGAIGWLLPVGKEKQVYAAQMTVLLGSYEDAYLNSGEMVVSLLSSDGGFSEWFPELEDRREGFSVNMLSPSKVFFSYSSYSEEEAISNLSTITEAFLKVDEQRLKEKQNILMERMEELYNQEVSEDGVVDKERFLYELQTTLFQLKPAIILENVTVKQGAREFSQRERAIVGGILGLMFGATWIVLPALLANQHTYRGDDE